MKPKKRCNLRVAVKKCNVKQNYLSRKIFAVKRMQCNAEINSRKNRYCNVKISGHTDPILLFGPSECHSSSHDDGKLLVLLIIRGGVKRMQRATAQPKPRASVRCRAFLPPGLNALGQKHTLFVFLVLGLPIDSVDDWNADVICRKIERGVPQTYIRTHASSATLCSVHVLRVFLCIFYIKKGI